MGSQGGELLCGFSEVAGCSCASDFSGGFDGAKVGVDFLFDLGWGQGGGFVAGGGCSTVGLVTCSTKISSEDVGHTDSFTRVGQGIFEDGNVVGNSSEDIG